MTYLMRSFSSFFLFSLSFLLFFFFFGVMGGMTPRKTCHFLSILTDGSDHPVLMGLPVRSFSRVFTLKPKSLSFTFHSFLLPSTLIIRFSFQLQSSNFLPEQAQSRESMAIAPVLPQMLHFGRTLFIFPSFSTLLIISSQYLYGVIHSNRTKGKVRVTQFYHCLLQDLL